MISVANHNSKIAHSEYLSVSFSILGNCFVLSPTAIPDAAIHRLSDLLKVSSFLTLSNKVVLLFIDAIERA